MHLYWIRAFEMKAVFVSSGFGDGASKLPGPLPVAQMERTGQMLGRAALACLCLLPVIGAFYVSTGLFTIDELIHLLAVDAFANQRALTVDNGYSSFGSDDLKVWFLVSGPNGLAPQYPPGVAIFGAPLYALFGLRGLVLLNSLAALGTALVTWKLAVRLYRDPTIAALSVATLVLGTFFLEYAWAIWPHMTSCFFVLLALWLTLCAIDAPEPGSALRFAVGAGLAVGAGVMMRTDTVLILPVIAAVITLYSTRPVRMILGGTLGLAPGLAVLALVNQHKFGTMNFLSYGRNGSGGGDDLSSHSAMAVAMALILAACLAARLVQEAPRWRVPVIAGAGAGLGALLLLPGAVGFVGDALRGYLGLFVDSRTLIETRAGTGFADDGTLIFWGTAKKAIFQSLPWLGILAALVLGAWPAAHRRGHLVLSLMVLIWTLPFAALSWHGGYSSNMRYFFPLLPALAILGSAALTSLGRHTSRPVTLILIGLIGALAVELHLFTAGRISLGYFQQALTLQVFIVVALLAALTTLGASIRKLAAPAAMVGVGAGLATTTVASVVFDTVYSQIERANSARLSAVAADLPGPALFYGAPKGFASAVERSDGLIGVQHRLTGKIDADLFHTLLGAGYRIYATYGIARRAAELDGIGFIPVEAFPEGTTVEIVTSEGAEHGLAPDAAVCPSPSSWCDYVPTDSDPRTPLDRLW